MHDTVCTYVNISTAYLQMPRIWIDYCTFLVDQNKITRTRHVFDRALRALPLTQHRRVWPLYLKFVRSYNIPETAIRVYRRYMKVRCPNTSKSFTHITNYTYITKCIHLEVPLIGRKCMHTTSISSLLMSHEYILGDVEDFSTNAVHKV